MADCNPLGSGRGPVDTHEWHTRMPAAALAVLALCALALIAVAPRSSRAASYQAIQANIGEKRSAIDRARAKEGVLTGDISAISKRIRTMSREIGSLRRREARVQNTLEARRAQLERVRARYQEEHDR